MSSPVEQLMEILTNCFGVNIQSLRDIKEKFVADSISISISNYRTNEGLNIVFECCIISDIKHYIKTFSKKFVFENLRDLINFYETNLIDFNKISYEIFTEHNFNIDINSPENIINRSGCFGINKIVSAGRIRYTYCIEDEVLKLKDKYITEFNKLIFDRVDKYNKSEYMLFAEEMKNKYKI